MNRFFSACPTLATVIFCCSTSLASELNTFKYSIPDLEAGKLLMGKSATDFSAPQKAKRSSGKNIFLKVVPSVVKVLTNEGSGSGVIISNAGKGYIITNHHVISGYGTVGVVFSNDSDSDDVSIGTVLKYDEIKDLALITLNQKRSDLVPIQISDTELFVGDDVHAVGHPLGEDWTYTRGYVSQIRQDYSWQVGATAHHVADVIQTQTPINPGNSGGPLVNEQGHLVGINTFGRLENQGMNYSVANSSVQDFLNSPGSIERKVMSSDNFGTLVSTDDDNKNGVPDFYYFDESGNQKVDFFAVDADEDLWAERLMFDANENGVIELAIFDFEADNGQIWVVYEFDKDEDSDVEAWGVDYDRDGEIDKIVPKD